MRTTRHRHRLGNVENQPQLALESAWDEFDDAPGEDYLPMAGAESSTGGQGPCLFLGPTGQRCARQAVDGGFCVRHQPGGTGAVTGTAGVPSRAFAAVVTIGILLWPYIADAVREILRWA